MAHKLEATARDIGRLEAAHVASRAFGDRRPPSLPIPTSPTVPRSLPRTRALALALLNYNSSPEAAPEEEEGEIDELAPEVD